MKLVNKTKDGITCNEVMEAIGLYLCLKRSWSDSSPSIQKSKGRKGFYLVNLGSNANRTPYHFYQSTFASKYPIPLPEILRQSQNTSHVTIYYITIYLTNPLHLSFVSATIMIKKITQLLQEGKEVIITLAVGEAYDLVGRQYSEILINKVNKSDFGDFYVKKEWHGLPECRYLKVARDGVYDFSGRYIRIAKYKEVLDPK